MAQQQWRAAGVLVGGVVALLGLLVGRASLLPSVQPQPEGAPAPWDARDAAGILSEVVAIPTVSGPGRDDATFEAMGAWLDGRFEALWAATERVPMAGGRLHIWHGTDQSLDPVLFLAHQDVVPVEPGTEGDWSYPPYSGAIAPCGGGESGDCVWGRGAIDMKLSLVGILSAGDRLAQDGWQPTRTVMFWMSEDEEVGGLATQRLSGWLSERGISVYAAYDEGLVLTEGLVPGVSRPVALVGTAEKGYLTVTVTVPGEMGHSSLPPVSGTAVGALGAVVTALETQPFEAKLDGPARAMFDVLGPEMAWPERAVFTNTWLLSGLVLSQLERERATNALVRTTQAPTMLSASDTENVLPQTAQAVMNLRLHPRDSVDGAVARLQQIAEDTVPGSVVEVLVGSGNTEPSKESATDHPAYTLLAEAVRRQVPDSVVAPGLFIAATDSRHLQDHVAETYRFTPVRMRPADLGRAHGTDERVRVDDLGWAFAVMYDLVRGAGTLEVGP